MIKKYFFVLVLTLNFLGVTKAQTCDVPTAPSVSMITATTATISWSNPSGATQWEIALLLENDSEPDSTTSPTFFTTVNPFVVTGLSPCTGYKWYVRAVCSPGETSAWSGPQHFTTVGGFSCSTSVQPTTVTLTIAGPPNTTYNYSLDGMPPQVIVANASGNATVLVPTSSFPLGVHQFLVQNTINCSCSSTFTINPSSLYVNINATADIPISALFTDVVGGNPPYTYQWYLDGNLIPGATAQIQNVMGQFGLYQVTVTDASAATASANFYVQGTPITASSDTITIYPGSSSIATSSTSVLSNDFLNGLPVYPSQLNDITLIPLTVPSGFTINPNGTISVLPGTAPGTYNVIYKICSVQNPTSCSANTTATVTIANEGFLLNAFLDTNNNGIQDSGENNFNFGNFQYEINSSGSNSVASSNGMYYIQESNPANSYTFSYVLSGSFSTFYSVSPASYNNITFSPGSGVTIYNFPVTQLPYSEALVYIIPNGAPPRPGFIHTNTIYYYNRGNQTISNGTLSYTKPNAVTITSVSETGISSNANGFTFNFTNLQPNEIRHIDINMAVPTIPTVQLGDLLTSNATLSNLSADTNSGNNTYTFTQTIVGSYDPNDKTESHGGKIVHAAFGSNDYLTYTIQFENTGTYAAENVKINDILDTKLDETSVKMIHASHPYLLSSSGNNLNWNFNGIDLAPSGKGHVTFQIKPKVGYAIGDIIPNTASIYFDFNPAIVTNIYNTEFVTTMSVSEFNGGKFVVYPNPTKGQINITSINTETIQTISITDILGKIILEQNFASTNATINIAHLMSGIYFLAVESNQQKNVIKIVKQ